MDADGKPLPNNFDRPERHDVKKPGPNFNTNNYGFYNYDYENMPYPIPHHDYPNYG